tara:strand:- start:42 stop:296 length:255 start_codon:yes stop_codon:yes gene_type:complete
VLVDDTVGKCPFSPGSVLLVNSWEGPPCAGRPAAKADRKASMHILRSLGDHLMAAAHAQGTTANGADVRAWLVASPFANGVPPA